MSETQLDPSQIKSPIQLVAAWFAMLVILVGVLLTAAAHISEPNWAAGFLIIASAVVIVGVLTFVAVMLTVFRPHLQEGKEYSEWLKDKNAYATKELAGASLNTQGMVSSLMHMHQGLDASLIEENIRDVKVSLSNSPKRLALFSALEEEGFDVELYGDGDGDKNSHAFESHEAIWVGDRIDARSVIDAMKIAIRTWSYLKYIHLSGDDNNNPPDYIHEQIFLGGSTVAAQRYGLEPWSNQEIEALDNSMSIKELHKIIRSKY